MIESVLVNTLCGVTILRSATKILGFHTLGFFFAIADEFKVNEEPLCGNVTKERNYS